MREAYEQIRRGLAAFVEQRDDLVLRMTCSDTDAAIALKILRDTEQANQTDVFLLFAEAFTSAALYVEALVAQVLQQHASTSACLIEAGKDSLAPPPPELLETRRAPVERLREGLWFASKLIPRDGGHRLVWAMIPTSIHAREEYLRLLVQLNDISIATPRWRGIRIIAREPNDGLDVLPPLCRRIHVDFSPAAIERGLTAETEDAKLPLSQRMTAFLSLACLDLAHGRTKASIAKLQTLLGYHQSTENATMQAVVMTYLGDTSLRASDSEQARRWYESALIPAARAGAPAILANIIRSLGELEYSCRQYPVAIDYFSAWAQLATRMCDPESRVRALEWRGLAQEQRKELPAAIASWEESAGVCRDVHLTAYLRLVLERLRRSYSALGRTRESVAVERELRTLPAQEPS